MHTEGFSVCVLLLLFFLPVDAFMVVVGVEELHLLEGLGAGETAGDGRMH